MGITYDFKMGIAYGFKMGITYAFKLGIIYGFKMGYQIRFQNVAFSQNISEHAGTFMTPVHLDTFC